MPTKKTTVRKRTQKGGEECNSCEPETATHHVGKDWLVTYREIEKQIQPLKNTAAFNANRIATEVVVSACKTKAAQGQVTCTKREPKTVNSSFPMHILGGKKSTTDTKKRTTTKSSKPKAKAPKKTKTAAARK